MKVGIAGRVINNRIFIFGWTNPLSSLAKTFIKIIIIILSWKTIFLTYIFPKIKTCTLMYSDTRKVCYCVLHNQY